MSLEQLLQYNEVCDKIIAFCEQNILEKQKALQQGLECSERIEFEIDIDVSKEKIKRYRIVKSTIVNMMQQDMKFKQFTAEVYNNYQEKEANKYRVI